MVIWAPIYVLPAILCCFVIRLLAKSKAPLLVADWAALLAPWFVWFLTVEGVGMQKSLSNLAEGYLLAVIYAITYWVRLKSEMGHTAPARAALVALLFVCAVSVVLAIVISPLPE